MKRAQGQPGSVVSHEPGGRTCFGQASAGPSRDTHKGPNDDAIDIVAVVAAIVLMTLIALAC